MQKYAVALDPSTGRQTLIVPVVNPNGAIKYCRANENAHSAIVQVSNRQDPRTGRATLSVDLRAGFSELGWSLLADDFRADNKEAAWGKFREWMERGPMVTPGGRVAPWPDKYLPDSVIERRTGRAPHLAPPEEIVIPELDACKPADAPEGKPASPNRGAARGAA